MPLAVRWASRRFEPSSILCLRTLTQSHHYACASSADARLWLTSICDAQQEAVRRSMGHVANASAIPVQWKKCCPTQGEDPAASGGDRNDVNVNGGGWTLSSRVLWISISGRAIEPRILASTSLRHADRENRRRTWPTTVVHRGDLWKLEHGYSTNFSRPTFWARPQETPSRS